MFTRLLLFDVYLGAILCNGYKNGLTICSRCLSSITHNVLDVYDPPCANPGSESFENYWRQFYDATTPRARHKTLGGMKEARRKKN